MGAQAEMVNNLLSVANELKAPNRSSVKLPPQIQNILVDLHKRSATMKAGLAKLDETQKKSEADLDAALKKQVGSAGNTDTVSKAQAMIRSEEEGGAKIPEAPSSEEKSGQ